MLVRAYSSDAIELSEAKHHYKLEANASTSVTADEHATRRPWSDERDCYKEQRYNIDPRKIIERQTQLLTINISGKTV